ncbi:hypothetical protein ERO13_A13G077601v2 [Gossypium hirsutum]|nr:hypothetical protein ERO13_A13G077601v2 [Gossypium hirsutum]
MSGAEEQMQQLRSKATELLLREEWRDSIQLYSELIDLCQSQISNTHQHSDPGHLPKLHKSLCVAFSNRAEARSKLQHFTQALNDCDQALQIEATHFRTLICKGENEAGLEVPDMSIFRPEIEENGCSNDQKLDMDKILSILDVNSLVEEAVSAKVLGKNSDFYGVGLWILVSFINHSCNPNARRLHVGDYVIVHASRDVKAGEEIT